MNPAPPVTKYFMGASGAHRPVGAATLGEVGAQRVGAVAFGDDRVGDAPVSAEGRVVPGDSEFVGGVVVAVDEVGHDDVGEGGEPVGDAGRDVHAPVVLAADVE